MSIGPIQLAAHGAFFKDQELFTWIAMEDELIRKEQFGDLEFNGAYPIAILRRTVKATRAQFQSWQDMTTEQKQESYQRDKGRIESQNEAAVQRAEKVTNRLLDAQERIESVVWPEELVEIRDRLLDEIMAVMAQEGTPELSPVWNSRSEWYQFWLDHYREIRDKAVAELAEEEAKPENIERKKRIEAWETLLDQVGVKIR